MAATAFRIVPVSSETELRNVARLFREYADSLGVDLGYQDFDTELATLPGRYAAPAGSLLLALGGDGAALGCVGLRPAPAPADCELKRLYVAPAARGLGLGGALLAAAIREAAGKGYARLLLDTLPTMHEAMALYERAGFRRTAAYYPAAPGTLFFSLPLQR